MESSCTLYIGPPGIIVAATRGDKPGRAGGRGVEGRGKRPTPRPARRGLALFVRGISNRLLTTDYRLLPFGFVLHDLPRDASRPWPKWLRFARSARRAQDGRQRAFLNPQSAIEELGLFRTLVPTKLGSFLQPPTGYRLPPFGFVSHHGSTAASCFQHQTLHFTLLLFIRLPLLPAVLHESAQKNGLCRLPKLP